MYKLTCLVMLLLAGVAVGFLVWLIGDDEDSLEPIDYEEPAFV